MAASLHSWTMFSRTAAYAVGLVLPIIQVDFVQRHLGVSTAVVKTPYTPERWESLAPQAGIVIRRDAVTEFEGLVTAREMTWNAESGEATINIEAKGDEQRLAERLVFPDPLRAEDDQTVNDYWTYPSASGQLPLETLAAQEILDRIDAGLGFNPDWTFDGASNLVLQFHSDLVRLYGGDPMNSSAAITFLMAYISAHGLQGASVPASTGMLALISDQAGATSRFDRQIPGLGLASDPVLGASRMWTGLFDSLLDKLIAMGVASGVDLGLRMASSPGRITASIVAPRDLSATVKFTADFRNLVGYNYREDSPGATRAVAAGQGNLHLRLRRVVATTDPLATMWGRDIWSYVDRRDTAVAADLLTAAQDELDQKPPAVTLAVTLLDTEVATYRQDWLLGDKVTVYVGLPGQTKPATVSDVVREIAFSVGSDGAEKITPAIGSYDAKAVLPTLTQQQLAAVGSGLSSLIARQ